PEWCWGEVRAESETLAVRGGRDTGDRAGARKTVIEIRRKNAAGSSDRRLRRAVERSGSCTTPRLGGIRRRHLLLLPGAVPPEPKNRADRAERVTGDRKAGAHVLEKGIELGGVTADLAPKQIVGKTDVETRQQVAQQ